MNETKERIVEDLIFDKNFQEACKLLNNKEQLVDNIMNTIGGGLSIQDKNMKIVYQNKFVSDNYGSHIGEYCYKVYEGRDEVCEGCPIASTYEDGNVRRALRTATTKNGEEFQYENIASVLKNDKGEVVAAIELVQIVQNKETAYDELRIATKNLLLAKTVFENSNEGIIVLDKNKKIISVNFAFETITGYKEKEVIGEKPEFLNSEENKNFYLNLWDSLKIIGSWRGEIWTKYKNGHKHAIMMNIDTIYSEKNEVLQYVCIFYDITEQKLVENELKHKEKMMISQSKQPAKRDMMGMLAYQWRQPLASICMEINTILINLEFENIEKKEIAETMSNVNTKLQNLSKSIDDFGDSLKKEKEIKRLLANEIIKKALKLTEKSLEKNSIKVFTNLKSQSSLTTYLNELIQVFINILSNAKEILINNKIKEPLIYVETEENEKEIIFRICDNAGGIKEELFEKIFEPYYTTNEKNNGVGLGLYISKIITEKYLKGYIKVKNGEEGACFEVILPKDL